MVLSLKLYVLDYLVKNGCQNAAAQFQADAQLGEQGVPVNVRDGALHE